MRVTVARPLLDRGRILQLEVKTLRRQAVCSRRYTGSAVGRRDAARPAASVALRLREQVLAPTGSRLGQHARCGRGGHGRQRLALAPRSRRRPRHHVHRLGGSRRRPAAPSRSEPTARSTPSRTLELAPNRPRPCARRRTRRRARSPARCAGALARGTAGSTPAAAARRAARRKPCATAARDAQARERARPAAERDAVERGERRVPRLGEQLVRQREQPLGLLARRRDLARAITPAAVASATEPTRARGFDARAGS